MSHLLIQSDSLNLHSVTPGLGNKPEHWQTHWMEGTEGLWAAETAEPHGMTWSRGRYGESSWWHQELRPARCSHGAPPAWELVPPPAGRGQSKEILQSIRTAVAGTHPFPSLLLPLRLLQMSWMLSGSSTAFLSWPSTTSPSWPLSTFLLPGPLLSWIWLWGALWPGFPIWFWLLVIL